MIPYFPAGTFIPKFPSLTGTVMNSVDPMNKETLTSDELEGISIRLGGSPLLTLSPGLINFPSTAFVHLPTSCPVWEDNEGGLLLSCISDSWPFETNGCNLRMELLDLKSNLKTNSWPSITWVYIDFLPCFSTSLVQICCIPLKFINIESAGSGTPVLSVGHIWLSGANLSYAGPPR